MNSDLLDRYIDAWRLHAHAGRPDGTAAMERLLGLVSEDVRYEDVAFELVFEGRDGIAKMCTGAYQMSNDFSFALVSRQTDRSLFAFEYTGTGTITATGRLWSFGRSPWAAFPATGSSTAIVNTGTEARSWPSSPGSSSLPRLGGCPNGTSSHDNSAPRPNCRSRAALVSLTNPGREVFSGAARGSVRI
jgi:SnoaL-like domain